MAWGRSSQSWTGVSTWAGLAHSLGGEDVVVGCFGCRGNVSASECGHRKDDRGRGKEIERMLLFSPSLQRSCASYHLSFCCPLTRTACFIHAAPYNPIVCLVRRQPTQTTSKQLSQPTDAGAPFSERTTGTAWRAATFLLFFLAALS